MPLHRAPNGIGAREATRGTETSKYPEEEKSTEIARVAASESAPAQTGGRVSLGALPRRGCGIRRGAPKRPRAVRNPQVSGTAWEGRP